jgi:hypothetical protein
MGPSGGWRRTALGAGTGDRLLLEGHLCDLASGQRTFWLWETCKGLRSLGSEEERREERKASSLGQSYLETVSPLLLPRTRWHS